MTDIINNATRHIQYEEGLHSVNTVMHLFLFYLFLLFLLKKGRKRQFDNHFFLIGRHSRSPVITPLYEFDLYVV